MVDVCERHPDRLCQWKEIWVPLCSKVWWRSLLYNGSNDQLRLLIEVFTCVMVKTIKCWLFIFNDRTKSVVLLGNLLQLLVSCNRFHLRGNNYWWAGDLVSFWTTCYWSLIFVAVLPCVAQHWPALIQRAEGTSCWDLTLRETSASDQLLIACQLQSCLSKHVAVQLNPSLIHKSIALWCSALFSAAWFW